MTDCAPLHGTDRSAIYISNLSFSYPGSMPVLQDVDLNIGIGEKVGLVGPNGSGKTTLFLLAGGILTPTSGEMSVMGSPVRPGGFNPELGFVFQNPDDQLFCPTVVEDLEFGLQNVGHSASESRALAEEYLDEMKMGDLAERPPHNLSGGEKRMISIAGVMIMAPSLVLLDEPESSLDSRYRRMLINFLRETGETLLIASHDLEFLLETCERVILLDDGRICADGPIREVLGNESLMNSHALEKPHSLVHHPAGVGHLHNEDGDQEIRQVR
jgi:cobalt/nickel transport system ATP-binding protein